MKFTPRWYQQEAVDSAIAWIKSCIDPCVIEAPTGSGKAFIGVMLAHEYLKLAPTRRVLVTAPSAELVKQNHASWLKTGEPASIYSASAGSKCSRHKVIFGTPGTIANGVGKFHDVGLVIIDEAHGITPTIKLIIESIRTKNKNLRVIGLSASPWRLGSGFIYANHYKQGRVAETCDPFFHSLVYTIDARRLIVEGFLSKPIFDPAEATYNTDGLTLTNTGNWDARAVEQAFEGQGRLTSQIVAGVVDKCRNRKSVLWFAATVQHAKEIAQSLPEELTRIVTAETKASDRELYLRQMKHGQIKHMVNVAVLTTGFDYPELDSIAILRATESAALLTQIIGRGLRIAPGKTECLILDFANNISRHFPDGDVFNPEIKAFKKRTGGTVDVVCPLCKFTNQFSPRENKEGYKVSSDGYFLDLMNFPILSATGQQIPSHYGRRCEGETLNFGTWRQCVNRWSSKTCPHCEADNDIAARYCTKCKGEIIDPNEKLADESITISSDPYSIRSSVVKSVTMRRHSKQDRPDSLRVDFEIEDEPHKISTWFHPETGSSNWQIRAFREFENAAFGTHGINSIDEAMGYTPNISKVHFRKKKTTQFFEVLSYE